MRFLTAITILLILFGCKETPDPIQGTWMAEIDVQGKPLPFSFEVRTDSASLYAIMHNGEETFYLNEVSVFGDSLKMTMHLFDSEIRARIGKDSLTGFFTKNFAENYYLPFRAVRSNGAARPVNVSTEDFSGKYQLTFVHEEKDTTSGIGIFEQTNSDVKGTILTPQGDYRYLSGNVTNGGELSLHTFDGEHLYVFTARKKNDSTLLGEFRSGKGWFEPWVGVKNDAATLPDADSLTILKDGYSTIDFSFPDLDSILISASDPQFKDKVLILQLFGSWCPNCMDETRFLSAWYHENQPADVVILGLAYEQKADYTYARSRVTAMKQRLNVPYDFVIAGTKDKDEASRTLPMLNRVIAFPTLIFVGKDGDVKRIHTGFNGPGTGTYYDAFKKDFDQTIKRLVSE